MADSFRTALSAVNDAVANLPADGSRVDISDDERFELLQSMEKLGYALESPHMLTLKTYFSAHNFTAILVARDMGVFNAFEDNEWKEMTLDELDAKTKGDKELLLRMMRIMVGHRTFDETGRYTFKPGQLARNLAPSSHVHLAIGHFFPILRTLVNMPEYFRQNDYRSPNDAMHGPFQYAFNTDKHFFDWLGDNPVDQRAFNAAMKANRIYHRQSWFDFFPVEEKLSHAPSGVAFIDIGGGSGHDIISLRKRFPASTVPGRFILQELQPVIDDITEPLPDGIESMTHDMFTAQPVKGARAYYLRTVLHDWPDKQASQVLTNIRKAMTPDSLLLINENTTPEEKVPRLRAEIDLTMMANFAALERTEKQWTHLLESSGFRILKVWRPVNEPTAPACLFEAVAKESSQL